MPTPLILDVDTGVDDALAILYAAASPEVDLIACTCVNGNVELDLVVRNTLAVLEAAGRSDVEVAAGARAPLREPERHGYAVHGPEGLGHAVVAEPAGEASSRGAVELLLEESTRRSDLMFVSTGPLTNVALALRDDPGFLGRLGSYTMMAGAFRGRGNTLPRSEANVWYDPEAAAEVFAACEALPDDRLPLAVGLDVTEEIELRPAQLDAICAPAPASPLARLVRDASEFYIDFERSSRRNAEGCYLHDPLAVAAAIDPALVTTASCHVEVELEGRHTRGETVADLLEMWRHPLNEGYGLMDAADNVRVALEVDEVTAEARFVERLRGLVEARA
ncbi:MAG TPA: nucleoside hydrolase [Actinomycetota bacterium]